MDDAGNFEVIGSRAELRERAVDPAKVDALPELHVPWIDEIQIKSHDGSKTLTRIPDVGDAWLDAGIVPFATLGFNGATDLRMPAQVLAENPDEYWQNWYPADFITEMREQVRLWFYSMLFMGVRFDRPRAVPNRDGLRNHVGRKWRAHFENQEKRRAV